ncbi:MAG: very short patch repair endonuclease [Elusimicrobiota bacterium]
MDRVNPRTRSRIMAAVKSRGGRTTERRLRAHIVASGIRGWRVNLKPLPGSPDFAFPRQKLAVFVDGCFWHGCPRCYRVPKSRVAFWTTKVASNVRRDRRQSRMLRSSGWRVIRLWEHAVLMAPGACVQRIEVALALRGRRRKRAA